MTIIICLVKGAACGVVPALLYKWLSGLKCFGKQGNLVGAIIASISAPIANTGVFTLGCVIIMDDVTSAAGEMGLVAENFVALLFIVLIGFNFFIEFAINTVFAPALNKLTVVLEKQFGPNSKKGSLAPVEEKAENTER